jgi:hypothetical protein
MRIIHKHDRVVISVGMGTLEPRPSDREHEARMPKNVI